LGSVTYRRRRAGNVGRDDAEFWERRRDSVLKARIGTGLVVTGAAGGWARLGRYDPRLIGGALVLSAPTAIP
jgi:hypothetical protein